MSRATKRKYVTKEVLEEFVEPSGDQEIVKVSNNVLIDNGSLILLGSLWSWK